MDVTAELVAPCSTDELFSWVRDLVTYPDWLEIVSRVAPLEEDADTEAWAVDLRGRLGPLARSKRLRMVRTVLDPPHAVTFERRELDGRQHSAWRLATVVDPDPDGARLRMDLHYGGSLLGPVIERLLRDEIESSKRRLLALVTAPKPG